MAGDKTKGMGKKTVFKKPLSLGNAWIAFNKKMKFLVKNFGKHVLLSWKVITCIRIVKALRNTTVKKLV